MTSGLSYDRPNNHYLDEDEAPDSACSTLRRSHGGRPSTGFSSSNNSKY